MTTINNPLAPLSSDESAASTAAPPPPPTLWDRLKAISLRKIRTAKETHLRFVQRAARGQQISDAAIEEWHAATEKAGYKDSDTANHIQLHRRLTTMEALAATLPTVRREMEAAQDRVNAIDAEIAELGTKRVAADNLWRQKLSEFGNANNALADVEAIRQEIAAIQE